MDVANTLCNIANVHWKICEYELAEQCFSESLISFRNGGIIESYPRVYFTLMRIEKFHKVFPISLSTQASCGENTDFKPENMICTVLCDTVSRMKGTKS